MNEHTSFQKYIILTLYSWKGWCLLCMSDEWKQGQFFSWPQQHFFLILAGLLNRGLLRATQSASWFSLWHSCLRLIQCCCGHLPVFFPNAHLLLLFFCLFTQVHLLVDGSVEGQYLTKELSFYFLEIWFPYGQ